MREIILNKNDFFPLATEVLAGDGMFTFRALGYSMMPFIYSGDVLTVQPIGLDKLKAGHIVLFRGAMDNPVAHRVISKTFLDGGFMVQTMGDALFQPDGLVGGEKILGRIISVRRGHRVICLDQWPHSFSGYLWAKLSPFRSYLLSTLNFSRQSLSSLLRMIQSLKMVRKGLKALFADSLTSHIAHIDEVSPLSCFKGFESFFSHDEVDYYKNTYILSASLADKVAGTLQLVNFDDEIGDYKGWWIWGMHVKGLYRGGGIGEELLKKAIRQAEEENAAAIKLSVYKNNRRAIALYRKLGFEETYIEAINNQFKIEDSKENNRIIMSKRIGFP